MERAGPQHPIASALPLFPRVSSTRGAAFLLAVYLSALILLLLGGISIQRTNTELRAAQQSRDLQQAFWLSEGAVDLAMATLHRDPTTTTGSFNTALGTSSYSVVTPPGNLQLREITSLGTAGHTTQRIVVNSQIQDYPAAGLVAGEGLYFSNLQSTPAPIVGGTFRVAGGTVGAIQVGNMTVDGPISIGPPGTTTFSGFGQPYTSLWIPGPSGYANGSGIVTDNSSELTKTPQVLSMGVPVRVDPVGDALVTVDNQDSVCKKTKTLASGVSVSGGKLSLTDTDVLTIDDGSPLDLSPPGDGRIVVCLQSLSVVNNSRLTFTAPATVYLVGTWKNWSLNLGDTPGGGPNQTGSIIYTGNAVTYGQANSAIVEAVYSDGTPMKNGLELVIPTWAAKTQNVVNSPFTGAIYMYGETFRGSVYAPHSDVFFGQSKDILPVLGIGMYIWFNADWKDGYIFQDDAQSKTDYPISLLSWISSN